MRTQSFRLCSFFILLCIHCVKVSEQTVIIRKDEYKMTEIKKTPYDTAIDAVSRIFPVLKNQPCDIKMSALEIRLKSDTPIIIRCPHKYHVLQSRVGKEQMQECVTALFSNSLHSFETELKSGFITLKGGHRAGFCGTAVYGGNDLKCIKDISGINIRIAREHIGSADKISRLFIENTPPAGLLIIGKPLSGKTTLLRDLCRSIGGRFRLSLIDERQEIAACVNGKCELDAGVMTDVYTGFCKKDGISAAIRTMSPDYIVTDELGLDEELIENCLNSGVGVILTAHARDEREALFNKQIRLILASGTISHICILSDKEIGKISAIYTAENLKELFSKKQGILKAV